MSRTQHVSRLAAPQTWPIVRKGIKWIIKPSPGTHNLQYSMPLLIFTRDILQITKNARELKKVLAKNAIKVNGKIVKKENFPVGIFDIIEVIPMKKYWRVLLSKKGKLSILEIPESEAKLLPVKVVSKKTLNKGKIQINLNNGWNLLDAKKYSVGDVLLLDTEKKTVAKHLKLQEGAQVYLIGGKHIGHTANLKEIKETGVLKKVKIAVLETKDGEIWQSPLEQLFIIGEKEPEIKVV